MLGRVLLGNGSRLVVQQFDLHAKAPIAGVVSRCLTGVPSSSMKKEPLSLFIDREGSKVPMQVFQKRFLSIPTLENHSQEAVSSLIDAKNSAANIPILSRTEKEVVQALASILDPLDIHRFNALFPALDLQLISNPAYICDLLTPLLGSYCDEEELYVLRKLFKVLPTQNLDCESIKKLSLLTARGDLQGWKKPDILTHLGAKTIQDPDFQREIALLVVEEFAVEDIVTYCLNFPVPPNVVIEIIERSTTHSMTGFNKYLSVKAKDFSFELRKDFALALIRRWPEDLLSCLEHLKVGSFSDEKVKKEVGSLLVDKGLRGLDRCLKILNLGELKDCAFRKELAYRLVEKWSFRSNSWSLSNCLEDLKLRDFQDFEFINKMIDNSLRCFDLDITQYLHAIGVDKIEDQEFLKKQIILCVEKDRSGLREYLSALGKNLKEKEFFQELVSKIPEKAHNATRVLSFLEEKGVFFENVEFRKKLALDLIHKQVNCINVCLEELNTSDIQDQEFQDKIIKGVIRNSLKDDSYLSQKIMQSLLEKMQAKERVEPTEFLQDLLQDVSKGSCNAFFLLDFFLNKTSCPEALRKETALHLVHQNVYFLYECLASLDLFGIQDDAFREKLAYAVVEIKNFSILSILREMGAIGARHPKPLSENIQTDLLRLIYAALDQTKVKVEDPLELNDFVCIVSEENRYLLAKDIVLVYPESWRTILERLPLKEEAHIMKILQMAASKNPKQAVKMLDFFFNPENIGLQSYAYEVLILGSWSEENKKAICKQLFRYRNQQMSLQLFKSFLFLENSAPYNKAFTALSFAHKQSNFAVYKILPSITLAKWMTKAPTENVPPSIALFLQKYRDELRDGLKPLLPQLLLTLQTIDGLDWPVEKKLSFFSAICAAKDEPKNIEVMVRKLRLANSVAALDPKRISDIPNIESSPLEALNQLFFDSFFSVFSFEEMSREEVTDLYMNLEVRVPCSLETFIGSACKAGIKDTMQTFLFRILKGPDFFKANRYNADASSHLEYIQKNYPEVLEGWKSLNIELSLGTEGSSKEEKTPLTTFFQDKLFHRHWHTEEDDKLPRLTHFLQTGVILEEPEEKTPFSQIETLCMKLIQTGDSLSEEDRRGQVEGIMKLVKEQKLELANDLKTLCPPKNKIERLGVAKWSDYWQNLFFCGTDVEGSCQRVDGSPHLNKCLMGYCLDGKIALLMVEDPQTKKIQARRIIRLLLCGGKPVLFVSRLYTARGVSAQGVDPALISLAEQIAHKLSIPLFLPGQSPDTSQQPSTLQSIGGPPGCFEYVDEALGNAVTSGEYEVHGYRYV